jgi:hypothetical protein
LFFTRWSWLLKRGSTDRSGRPSALQMSSSGFALKAPTSTSGPVWVWNTPDSGMAAQFTSESAIMIIAASCICMASMELYSETLTFWPSPVRSRCSSANRMPCTMCMPAV